MYPVQFQGDIARDTIDFQGIAGSFICFLLGMHHNFIHFGRIELELCVYNCYLYALSY